MAGPFLFGAGRMLGLSGSRLSGSNPRCVHESAHIATNSGLNLSAPLQLNHIVGRMFSSYR
jgi:hypothetical protein